MISRRHGRMALRFLRHRFGKLHPFEVQAQLLNACDRKCLYCKCPQVETSLLPTSQWLQVIRSLGELGTIRIKFQGGEPTLHEDFRQLCREAQRAGIIAAAVSNGARVAEEPALLDFLDEIVISIDSPGPDVNDRLRGEGSFDAALKAVEVSLGRGVRAYVNMTVCRVNYHLVKEMLSFCEDVGVMLNAQPVKFGKTYYNDEAGDLGLSDNQIRDLHRQLVSWKRDGRGLMFSPSAYGKVLSWADPSILSVGGRGGRCRTGGRSYVHIDPNGDVHPCIQHSADIEPKNIQEDGLFNAFLHVRDHNCSDCWSSYLEERKLLLTLRPSAVLGVLRRG